MRLTFAVLLIASLGWLAYDGFLSGRPAGRTASPAGAGGIHAMDDGVPPPPNPPFNPGP